jgi:SAM-dependent methyltransferase
MSAGPLLLAVVGSVSGMLVEGGATDPPTPVPESGPGLTVRSGDVLERFRAEVAREQLAEWLPVQAQVLLDLSPSCPRLLDLMISRGHTVIHAVPELERPAARSSGSGRLHRLRADGRSLDWVTSGSVDGVIAEGGCLSTAPAAELTFEDIHRVLRPGGRLLLSVDSLVAGLSRLADQGRWAELADVPAADVLLVPDGDSVIRCFWPEELHAMLADAGFDVEWVRPRTVLADQAVSDALLADPARLPTLVTAELTLSARREGEAIGNRLVASARRR